MTGIRRAGRPKGSISKRTQFARDWCDRLGVADPVEFLVTVMNADTVEVTQADEAGNAVVGVDGKPMKRLAVVSLDTRIQCARELLEFMYPRLKATQSQILMDVNAQPLPTDAILADPKLADALGDLALLMSEHASPQNIIVHSPELDRVIGD